MICPTASPPVPPVGFGVIYIESKSIFSMRKEMGPISDSSGDAWKASGRSSTHSIPYW